jgi:hypothetical protein
MRECFIECSAGKSKRCGCDRRPEYVERAHSKLETFACAPEEAIGWNSARLKAKGSEWMRRYHIDPFGDRKTGIVGKYDKGANTACAMGFASASEYCVHVGYAAV